MASTASAGRPACIADRKVPGLDRVLDDVLDRREVADVRPHGHHSPGAAGQGVARLLKRVRAQVAEHQVGVRLGRQLPGQGGAERAAGPENGDDPPRASISVFLPGIRPACTGQYNNMR
jgi:hypothetical protein